MIDQTTAVAVPASPAIEASVLGAILRRPVVLDEIPEGEELFYDPRHRVVFRWLQNLRPQGDKAFDLGWLCQRIDDARDLAAAGGMPYVEELSGRCKLSRLAADISELREKRARRLQIETARWAMEAASDQLNPEFMDALVVGTAQVAGALEGISEALSNADLIGESLDRFQKRLRGTASPMGLPTIPEIDYVLKGMHPKRMWVIGAYPGGGKSVIASQIVTDTVLDGRPAVFLTLEMQEADQIDRMMIQSSRVPSRLFSDPRAEVAGQAEIGPTKGELEMIGSAARRLSQAPLRVQRPASRKLGVIVAALRRAHREMGAVVGVVDYLQLIQVIGPRGQTREDEMKQISHALAEVAHETGMHLLVLSQLNADGETKHGRVVEEDCDAFLTIDQDRNRNSEHFKQHLGLTLVKDRFNGNSGRKIPLIFDSEKLRFVHGYPVKPKVDPPRGSRFKTEFQA